MSLTMADLLPPFPLPRSSSRDNKVSCETLSHVDWFSTPKFERRHHFLYDAEEIYWDATDPDLDYAFDDASKVGRSFPPAASTAAHLFGCFPSKTASYLPPRTMMMSPGKEDKRGSADTAGRPRMHSSLISHSGGIPHSGPIKLNTGPIIGHSGPLKGPAKGPSIIPADVVGKKKPPGYEDEEPRSPEVTCLGHVRMKHKSRKDSPRGGDKKQFFEWKCNFFKKKAPQDLTDKGAKHSTRKQTWTERDKFKNEQHQEELAEKFPLPNAAETDPNRGERSAMFSDYLTQVIADKGRAETADEAEYEPQVPPPNSLLLMRGSRNLERESQKPEVFGSQELPSITQKGSVNRAVNRQISLPKPPPEASIWQRRNISQPTALDTRIPVKLEIKQPCTK